MQSTHNNGEDLCFQLVRGMAREILRTGAAVLRGRRVGGMPVFVFVWHRLMPLSLAALVCKAAALCLPRRKIRRENPGWAPQPPRCAELTESRAKRTQSNAT